MFIMFMCWEESLQAVICKIAPRVMCDVYLCMCRITTDTYFTCSFCRRLKYTSYLMCKIVQACVLYVFLCIHFSVFRTLNAKQYIVRDGVVVCRYRMFLGGSAEMFSIKRMLQYHTRSECNRAYVALITIQGSTQGASLF